MPVLTALYPAHAGARFDHDYYRDTHLKLARTQLGDALVGVEALQPTDAATAGFAMVTLLRFRSPEDLAAALTPAVLEALMADIPKFTDITPQIQINRPFE